MWDGSSAPNPAIRTMTSPVPKQPNNTGHADSAVGDAERLFRMEAVTEQQAVWLGTVLLAPRASHNAMAVFALTIVGLLVLLLFGSYTRTARVGGLLVSAPGLVRVFAPQQGVLVHLYVREGDAVTRGMPLMELSTELQTQAQGDTRVAVVRRLQSRRDSLLAVRRGQEQLQANLADNINKRLQSDQDVLARLSQELVLLRSRFVLASQTVDRQQLLYASRLVSVQTLNQAQDFLLQIASQQQSLERQKTTLEQERMTLAADLVNLPLKNQAELAETDRTISTLEQEIAETEARRQIVVTAPQDGTVSAVQAELGSSANTTVPLLSIIPAGSTLQAQLFAPSRSIGFVAPGQRVLLRYEAFPYQRFGRSEGAVASVSRAAISPAELPQQLTGLTTLYDVNAPIYRITVALTQQAVTAYGKPVPLQPGMQLEADVLLERRRLIEWVFDPLYTLVGREQG